jgi:hypothetical protein
VLARIPSLPSSTQPYELPRIAGEGAERSEADEETLPLP